MGWIEKAKEIVKGLKESGKSEKEISEIIEVAADKATVNKDVIKEQFVGKEEIEMIADTMIKIGGNSGAGGNGDFENVQLVRYR